MRLFKGMLVAACAAFFVACGGGNPTDKMLGHVDKVVSIVEANKGDLDKAAKEVEAFFASNKDTLEADAKAVKAWGEEQEKKFKDDPEGAAKLMASFMEKGQKLQDRLKALEKEIPNLKEHEGLKNAMKGLGGLMGGF